MRTLVHASLPMGTGIVLDPFAGSGSTLAAASAIGYQSIGIERNAEYVALAKSAFAGLKSLRIPDISSTSEHRRNPRSSPP